MEDWLTTYEAADISGYELDYIRKLIRAEKIQGRKWGAILAGQPEIAHGVHRGARKTRGKARSQAFAAAKVAVKQPRQEY